MQRARVRLQGTAMRMRVVQLLGLLACNPVLREVPVTAASLAAPITEVRADPDTATLIISDESAWSDQAVTIVRDDAIFVAQLAPHSFAAVRIPPGHHTLLSVVPVFGPEYSGGIEADFKQGKVYVVAVGGLFPVPVISKLDAPTKRALSVYSHYIVDEAKGRLEVSARADYWRECAAHFASTKQAAVVPSSDQEFDVVAIPQPP